MGMRRLYQKIYLVFLASLLAVVVFGGVAWHFGQAGAPHDDFFELGGELAQAALPSADAPRETQQRAVERLGTKLRVDLAVFDQNRAPIATAGRPLPRPLKGGWLFGSGGPTWTFPVPDGGWLVARARARPVPLLGLTAFLAAMAVAIAIFAYPVVRGLTRRLERLKTGVETLGAGNLATRVAIEGRDEIAQLAASFNRAAARIEELVGAHRLLLANASHEVRTPLSRIRLGIELFDAKPSPKIKAELVRDIAELDELIEEILLASRLDAAVAPPVTEDVDLLALAAEECARYDGCSLDGDVVTLRGDPRLLRRLLRNLLDNAQRHGRPPIRVELRRDGPRAALAVLDSGDGIPPAAREQVFLPFRRIAPSRGCDEGKEGDRKEAGAGLGLALVRQIARLHGGDAVVTTRADAPSCLVATLLVNDPGPGDPRSPPGKRLPGLAAPRTETSSQELEPEFEPGIRTR
jgi:signal transduction histidine kinase